MKSPLLIFATFIVLLLTGVVTAPFFIDWSQYRAEIEAYGARLMGRDVRIAGDINIHFLPLPALSLEDVRVANADTAFSPVFIAVKKIEARLLLAPLLRGQVRVHSMDLKKPVIDIERLASGNGNWYLGPSEALWLDVPASDFALEEIRIVNGTFYLRDHRRGGSARLDQVSMKVSAASLNGPFKAEGMLSYHSEPTRVSISTGKLRKDGSMRLTIRLNPQTGARLIYSFDGELMGKEAPNFAEGRLKVAPPPIEQDGKSGRLSGIEKLPFLLTANVALAEDKITFNKIDLALNKANTVTNAITGSVELSLSYDIGVEANLSARRVDLDALARDVGTMVKTRLKTAIDLDTLDTIGELLPDGVRGHVVFSAGQLKTGAAVIESGKLDIRVTDTGVKISELSGMLPGRAQMSLSGLYLPDPVTPQFDGKFTVNALDGRGFLNWLRPGLYGEEAGRIGRLKLNGFLSATPENARISDANIVFNGQSSTGTIFWTRRGTPFISVKVEAGNLNLTNIMPDGDKAGLLDVPGLVRRLNTGPAPVSLDMKAARLTFGTRTLKNFVTYVRFFETNTDVRRLAATIGKKGQIDLAGTITGAGGTLNGKISGKVNSSDAAGLLEVLGSDKFPPRLSSALRGEPLDVWVEYTSNHGSSRLNVEGLAGGGLTGIVFNVKGPLSKWRKAELSFEGKFETHRTGRLLKALKIGWNGRTPPGKANAKINVKAQGALPSGLTTSLSGSILGVKFEASGNVSDPGSGLLAKGSAKLQADNAAVFGEAVGAGVALDGPLHVSGQMASSTSSYSFNKIKIALPGIKGSFDGALTPNDDQFHLIGAARFEQLDLSPAFGLLTLAPARSADAEPPFWANRPFHSESLQDLSADVTVSADELILAPGVRATNSSFIFKAGENTMSLFSAKGDLLGGAINAELILRNEAGGNLDVRMRIDSKDLDLSSILKSREDAFLVRGKVSLSGAVSGRGRSPVGIISALTGKGVWGLDNAVLDGTDPAQFSSSLDGVDDPGQFESLISSKLHNGSWPFDKARSNWSMKNGLLRFAPARLKTPAASGSLGALTDLASGELDLSWQMKISELKDAPGYSVKLTGPMDSLTRMHDTSGLHSFLVAKVLQEGMEKLEELQREQEQLSQNKSKKSEQKQESTEGKAAQQASEGMDTEKAARKVAEEAARKQAKQLANDLTAKRRARKKAANIIESVPRKIKRDFGIQDDSR